MLTVRLLKLSPSSVGSRVAHSDREGQSSQRAQVPPGHSEHWGVAAKTSRCRRGSLEFRLQLIQVLFLFLQSFLAAGGHLLKQLTGCYKICCLHLFCMCSQKRNWEDFRTMNYMTLKKKNWVSHVLLLPPSSHLINDGIGFRTWWWAFCQLNSPGSSLHNMKYLERWWQCTL